MSSNLSLDIQESIKKNLPSQVSEVLQKRLIELEGKEALLEQKEKQIKAYETDLSKLKEIVKTEEEITKREVAVKAREETAFRKDLEQERDEFKLKAAEAEKRADLSKEFVSLIFRNSILKENTFESRNVPVPVTQGNYTSVQQHTSSESYNKTITKE